ncbi:ATP-binding protein [bacterium]|nr:MAG: ATP-binding protein [bacterium]
MKFFNRQQELKALNGWWKKRKAQLAIIYGKRRVGKTALSLKFCENKPAVYFLSERLDIKLQLKKISKEIGQFFKDDYITEYGIEDWEQFFKYIASKKKKFILVIDEFPYLVDADPAIPSIFQKGWDLYLSKSPVFLILCGSSIGMMEEHTLHYKSPLYGRRSGQILVKPFSFFDLEEIFHKYSFEERLLIYSIVGGTITYLKPFLENKNIWQTVEKNILSKEQFLYEEVDFLLREELREPRNYFSILINLSLGKRKMSEIINATGFEKSTLSAYLAILARLLIIEKEIPITDRIPEKSKKGLYRISDNFFEFWFRYVFRYRELVEEGKQKEVLKNIKASIVDLISRNYEEIACEIVKKKFASKFLYVGRWWERNNEIDIVGMNNESKEIIFGEVKWSNKKVGTNIFKSLKEKTDLVKWNNEKRKEKFILFSKSGFTNDMKKLAKKEGVILVHEDRILK